MGLSHIIWEITNKCNLQCKHCYNADVYKDSEWDHLSLQDAKRVVDKLSDTKYEVITFLGGEPLLYPDLPELIQYVVSKKIKASVITNGTLLDEKMQERLLQSSPIMISISIDGITAEVNDAIRGQGTFDRILSNLASLQKKVYDQNSSTIINLGFVITQKNIHQIPDIPEWAYGLGVKYIDIQHLIPTGSVKNNDDLSYNWADALDAIVKAVSNYVEKKLTLHFTVDSKPLFQLYLKRKFGYEPAKRTHSFCMMGTHRLVIAPNGEVHPCGPAHFFSSKVCEQKLLQKEHLDIRTHDIQEIQFSDYFQSAFNLAYNPETYAGVTTCQGCQFQSFPCQPCPFFVLECGLTSVEECEYAKRKLESLELETMSKIPVPHPNLKWSRWGNKIIFFDYNAQEFTFMEGSGFQIWIRMNGRNTIHDIIKEIQDTVSDDKDKLEVQRQIMDFIYSIQEKYIVLKEVSECKIVK